jgi:chemotaxis protein methyltransferase CheR
VSSLGGEELSAWRQYICTVSGIDFEPSKAYLIESRLNPLLRSEGCASYGELYYRARSERGTTLRRKIIDAITIGETSFFRDMNPFELLKNKLIPELVDRRNGTNRVASHGPIPIRIWSAACSTGQEVYSIAIALREILGELSLYKIRLVGTDISDQAIARASYGQYSNFDVERGLSTEQRDRYFSRSAEGWRIRDELRALVSFQQLNLMDEFLPFGKFDIIFCRNVAIYFKEEDRLRLYQKIIRSMEPDGALVIGSTESVCNICNDFESRRYHRTVYYELKSWTERRGLGL